MPKRRGRDFDGKALGHTASSENGICFAR